ARAVLLRRLGRGERLLELARAVGGLRLGQLQLADLHLEEAAVDALAQLGVERHRLFVVLDGGVGLLGLFAGGAIHHLLELAHLVGRVDRLLRLLGRLVQRLLAVGLLRAGEVARLVGGQRRAAHRVAAGGRRRLLLVLRRRRRYLHRRQIFVALRVLLLL